MPHSHIHIEGIQLSVKGVKPSIAQEAVNNLGPTLNGALADPVKVTASQSRQTSATVVVSPNTSSASLRESIAAQIAAVINDQVRGRTPKGEVS